MKKRRINEWVPAFASLCILSCAGFSGAGRPSTPMARGAGAEKTAREPSIPEPQYPGAPEGSASASASPRIRFEPARVPDSLVAAPGVGSLSRVRGEPVAALDAVSAGRLIRAFQDAYVEALLRGLPLSGVLGADLVHRWPLAAPSTVVQNWRRSDGVSNSFGLPQLVLAMGDITGDRIFLVEGDLLDAYGRGEGLGGANGPEGYGVPLSDAFYHPEGRAQRFSKGLLVVSPSRARLFVQEQAPSVAAVADLSAVGLLEDGSSALVRSFRSAWNAAVDGGREPLNPDGPVLSFPWAGGTLYLQTFGAESWGLASNSTEGEKSRAFLVDSPVLSVLLQNLNAHGPPLTDPYPHAAGMAQRFLNGTFYY